MGFWDRVKKIYKKVDKAVGGYLPGGVAPGGKADTGKSTTTSTSKGTSSTGKSYSGSSSSAFGRKEIRDKAGNLIGYESEIEQQSRLATEEEKARDKLIRKVSVGQRGTTSQQVTDTFRKKGVDPKDYSVTSSTTSDDYVIGGGAKRDFFKEKKGFFSFGTKRDSPVVYGALFVTPKEAEQLKGTDIPYWAMESTSFEEGLVEGRFASGTPQINRRLMTTSLYQYNVQNILAQKDLFSQYKNIVSEFKTDPSAFEGKEGVKKTETEKGITYELTPEFFEKNLDIGGAYKKVVSDVKLEYSALPEQTRKRLSTLGYMQGVTSTAIGIVEFGGTIIGQLGVQQFEKPEDLFKTKQFYFTERSFLGQIRNYPTTPTSVSFLESPTQYAKEKATSPEFLGTASVVIPLAFQAGKSIIGNIKTYGVKGGLAETTSAFSPLRIKSGVYYERVTSGTKFDVQSLKYTGKGGVTTRVYGGKSTSGNIEIMGYEQSGVIKGKVYGYGYSGTSTPYLEIRGGGAFVTTGVKTDLSPYAFRTTGVGKAFVARGSEFYSQQLSTTFKGATSEVLTSRGITIYESETGAKEIFMNLNKATLVRGGGATDKITDGISRFVSGKRTAIYKTTYGETIVNLKEGTITREFIRSPSGRYKVSPQIRGIEYDINKLMSKEIGTEGYTFFKGGGSKSSAQFFKQLYSQSPTIPIIKTIPKVSTPSFTTPLPPQKTESSLVGIQRAVGGEGLTAEQIKLGQGSMGEVVQVLKIPSDIKKADLSLGVGTINLVMPKIDTGLKDVKKSMSLGALSLVSAVKIKSGQKEVSKTLQVQRVVQIKKVKLASQQALGFPSYFGKGYGGFGYPVIKPPIIIPTLPNILPGGLDMGLGKVKSRVQETRYVPSFTALFFKLRSKREVNLKTGIEFRGITPGFSFFNKPSIRRVRVIKI